MLAGEMLRRSAQRFPDKDAIVWGEVRMRYDALDAAANRLAHALRELAPLRGAKIGIICRNRPEYGVAFFSAARSCAVLVNVSVLYSPAELGYVLDKADIEILIVEHPFADKVAGRPETEPDVAIDERDAFS